MTAGGIAFDRNAVVANDAAGCVFEIQGGWRLVACLSLGSGVQNNFVILKNQIGTENIDCAVTANDLAMPDYVVHALHDDDVIFGREREVLQHELGRFVLSKITG